MKMQKAGNLNFRFVSFLFVLSLLGIFVSCNNNTQKLLEETAKEVNKNCPVRIDEITRLDNCEALQGNILVYNYTILDDAKFDVSLFRENGIPFIIETIRAAPEMGILRERDVTFRYIYKNLSGNDLINFDVSAADYKGE